MMNKEPSAFYLPWTGERFLPEVSGNIRLEHLHRYIFASELVAGKKVLDIACGEGYGSDYLAQVAQLVYGIDNSEEVINFAKEKYKRNNLYFQLGDCAYIPLPDASVDVVVSFETIEHHDQHTEMMMEIRRVLTTDGILILSSPDKYEYSDLPNYKNPYHVKELYREDLEKLIYSYFSRVKILGQRIMFGSNILGFSKQNSSYLIYRENAKNISVNQHLPNALYFIILASNKDLPTYSNSFFEGEYNTLKEKNDHISELSIHLKENEYQLQNLLKQLDDSTNLIAEKSSQIKTLEISLDVKEKRIKQLEILLNNNQTLSTNILDSLNEQNAQVKKLKANLTRQTHELDEANKQLISLQERMDSQSKQLELLIHQKEYVILDLSYRLNSIYHSNSWKFCRPLRLIRQYYKNTLVYLNGYLVKKLLKR